jgi:hypothetical protein
MNNSLKRLAVVGAANIGILFGLTGSSGPASREAPATAPNYLGKILAAPSWAPAPRVGPGTVQAPPVKTAAQPEVQAEILPAATFAVGSSLSGGPDGKSYGIGMTANDISNSWTTCPSTCTLDFVFFIFTNQDQPGAKVEFRVVAPKGTTVYQYKWTSKLVPTNWFTVYARGNYSAVGTYFAEVYVGTKLDGWVPMTFNKAA